METLIRAAAINWAIRPVADYNGFATHLETLVRAAAAQGANLVVLPECIDLERLSYAPAMPAHEIKQWLTRDTQRSFDLIQSLAASLNITLVGGTHLFETGAAVVNRCPIAARGQMTFQDKINLTQYELHEWGIAGGRGLYPAGPVGVTICYDSEFPVSGRNLAEAGVWVQCVPAYTETQRGFQRVRWSCQARALEHQVYVIHASLVGSLGAEPVPETYGSSAIIAPSVAPFPVSAVLAETALGTEGIAVADLDRALLETARNSDDVRNWHDRDRGDFGIREP
jgi:predicted amidohydrolase